MELALNHALGSIGPSGIRKYAALAAADPDCISLTLGEPDFDTPPAVCNQVGAALAGGDTHYIPNAGTMALRQAIADFEAIKNGMDYTAEEVIVTTGATESLFVSLFGILNPGDEVIIPTPAFGLYEQIVLLCRATPVFLDTSKDAFQITPAALGSVISDRTKAIILNSPNNPTGTILSSESLEAVRAAVTRHPCFVICDDVYRQLSYDGYAASFASFPELRRQILVVQSFSKPYAMTGWRVGYLMADRSIAAKLTLLHQYLVVSASSISQKACIEALNYHPTAELSAYRKRRDLALKKLEEMRLTVTKPEGAFYLFPSISKFGLSDDEFCTRLIREAHVAVVPGHCFRAPGFIRISYCCSMEALEVGLTRLSGFIDTLERSQYATH